MFNILSQLENSSTTFAGQLVVRHSFTKKTFRFARVRFYFGNSKKAENYFSQTVIQLSML